MVAFEAGISVLPIRADGSKQPSLAEWKVFQRRRASRSELDLWFRLPGPGLAMITGQVSENLEALDFDCRDVYEAWLSKVLRDRRIHALYERIAWGYLEATPAGGRHLLYRCSEIAGNQKLARKPVKGAQKYKTLIETRGEGGLIIVAPSRGSVHPNGKPYMLLRGGAATITTITPAERTLLLSLARTFDQVSPSEPRSVPLSTSPASPSKTYGSANCSARPGDLFNRLASWEDILSPHGWELVRAVGEEGQWRRPGKDGPGISATTNWQGSDLLYVFSTSTAFEPERGYSKFAAYALLNFHGDFSAAAKALVEQGYLERAEKVSR
jgi:putative DNA primase/helicase